MADTVILLCNAIKTNKPDKPVKFILMNTAGNRNRDLNESVSTGQKMVIGLIRLLLPPQLDNVFAADYLGTRIGQNDKFIEWVAIQLDDLVNKDKVTEFEVYPSPIKSAIFNLGKTSRINVGHFMASLIIENDLWNKWKGQMPVIYNKKAQKK